MKIDVRGLKDEQQAEIVLEMFMCAKSGKQHPLSIIQNAALEMGDMAIALNTAMMQSQTVDIEYILSSAFYTKFDGFKVMIFERLDGTPIKTSHAKRGGVAHLDLRLYETENDQEVLEKLYNKLIKYDFLKDRIFAFNPDKELRAAAKEGNLDEVKMLIEDDGANPNAVAKNGRTALHFAVSNNKPDVVEYLRDITNCAIKDSENNTPLNIAEQSGFDDIASIFTSTHSDVVEVVPQAGEIFDITDPNLTS